MKATYLLTMCIGDTDIDVHGSDDQVEEIYVSGTDHEISELIYALNPEQFKSKFKESLYYSRTY
jgi:hypothetical protein